MRVSSQQTYNNFNYFNKLRNSQLQENSIKMAKQRRYNGLGEAPIASAHSSYNRSRIQRYQQYQQNSSYAFGRYQLAESRIGQAIDAMQSIRELTVQAGNSTNTKGDLGQIGRVVNELLEEMLSLANSSDEQGKTLFAGNAMNQQPFAELRAYSPDLGRKVLTAANYQGDLQRRSMEVEDGVYIPINFVGNKVFWAQQHNLIAALPADQFRILADDHFFIDGQELQLQVGDNIESIVRKINDLGVAVRAEQDPITQAIILRTSVAHQMQLEQPQGSTVLQELGLLAAGNRSLSEGAHPNAMQDGASLFNVTIGLRDALFAGDTESIGSKYLAVVDQALDSLINVRTDLGARQQRLESQQAYSQQAVLDYQQIESSENDLDASEAISELQRLMTTQTAIYQSTARLSELNLMNFLRR